MTIRIVCYSYAPAESPRAFRWTALAEAWAAEGHRVQVVAGPVAGRPAVEELNGVNVHRPGSALLSAAPSSSLKRRVLRTIYRSLWKPLQWPDYASTWRRPAIGVAQSLGEADVLVSVSHPFTPHLVGEAHASSAKRWIMDVGDPFCFLEVTPLNNLSLYRKRNEQVERRLFAGASAVAVTCDATAKEYARRFPESAGKIRVIGPLAPDVAPSEARSHRGLLKLVYAGRLYPGIRSPNRLEELVCRLQEKGVDAELHLYGNFEGCTLPRTEGLLVHGPVSRETAQDALAEADVLVNVGNATRFQLPSKVVEYAAIGKPILNLAQDAQDSSARFFEGWEGVLNVFPSTTMNRIEAFLCHARSHPAPDHSLRLKPYRLPEIKRAYEGLWA